MEDSKSNATAPSGSSDQSEPVRGTGSRLLGIVGTTIALAAAGGAAFLASRVGKREVDITNSSDVPSSNEPAILNEKDCGIRSKSPPEQEPVDQLPAGDSNSTVSSIMTFVGGLVSRSATQSHSDRN